MKKKTKMKKKCENPKRKFQERIPGEKIPGKTTS